MKKQTTFRKRILSVVLCLALMLSCVPFIMTTAAADPSHYNRVVDASTMNNWTRYFDVNNLDTVNAGGVWTDKSVFTDASAFPNSVTMFDDDRHFLTALSAIAANKEIVGYSSVPTDTVLVLDLSNSMPTNARSQLVQAANDAIKKLYANNENNRVGVVLYSGDTNPRTYGAAVTRLMSIDRYSPASDGNYLSYSNGNVSVKRGVTGTNSNNSFGSKSFGGATYIQGGLWEAYKMFTEIPKSDTVIGDNNWQTGEARMPIVVLMSDGAPTLGSSNFADVENQTYGYNNSKGPDVGDGNSNGITEGQGFLVQLTASYIKNRIENHYDVQNGAGRSLFYTLGFNITADNNPNTVTSGDVAYSVLNPDASTVTDSLWTAYNATGANNVSVRVEGRNGGYTNVNVSKNSFATSKSYVDEYFPASNNGLTTAFDSIVEEIILQSRYYPTHLAGGNPDFSGYVEFTDTLGEYIEMKHINGILLGDTLYDGHMMASKIADNGENGLGTPAAPTALGDEFIRAVKTRLGIVETADAQTLVAKAYNDKQLYYENATNWSNYIAWYAKADGTYAGFYDKDGTEPVPAGAVYINRSYGFLGQTTGSIKNSDMMYMSVQVRTGIATGEQTVLWKIPASLVPMVTYQVTLDGTNVDEATNVNLTVADKNVAPIRLLYETGLRSDLNAFNITRITDSDANDKSDENHVAADGHTRLFWNNAFDISAADHEHHQTAMAEFTPNKENERFYYTFDSAVHKKVGNDYVLVGQNETLDANGEYYHRRYTFNENTSKPVFTYEKMSAASIRAATWDASFETLDHQTGAWVVAQGTPARELTMYDEEKIENKTNSAHMIFYPYLTEQNNTHYVDMNLGNNGRLAVTPAQGIQLSKTIDVYESGSSTDFSFRVTVHNPDGTPYTDVADTYITELNTVPTGDATDVNFSAQGTHVFDLSANETLWIAGLPAGSTYTIEEVSDNADYKIKSVHVNGTSTGAIASGTIAAYYLDDVDFVNTAIGDGDLVIEKQVIDAQGAPVDIADSVVFTAEVTLTNAQGSPVSGTFGNLTVPANGKFTVTLKEGESFTVHGIPEETRYTVEEINMPRGFRLNNQKSVLSGVVDASANDRALLVNEYLPVATNGQGINVKVTKQISGKRTEWISGESYTFRLEKLGTTTTTIGTATITANDATKEHLFSLANESYTAAGIYYYQVVEVSGSQGGITYDIAPRRFSVEVADADKNGTLEIVSVKNEVNTVVSGTWLVTANFNNTYAPTGSATATVNIRKEMNGNHPLSGYRFALYGTNPATDAQAVALLTSALTDAAGNASVSLTYSATDAGNTYTYYLAEIGRGTINNNVRYDTTVYEVEVTVTDNLDGTLSANTVVKNLPVGSTVPTFTNEYVPSASDYLDLSGKKTINGDRVLNANEFSFKLTALTTGAPIPVETVVKNAADGSFQFPTIEFGDAHKGNTYQYTITEVDTDKIGGFTYDPTVYTITVTVTDNGDQTITAAKVINNGTANVSDIVFTNTYDAKDAEVVLKGEKMLTGKTMQNGEFTFRLNAVTPGAPMPASATATNDASGAITFGKINYAKAGTYVYTLAEVDGGDTRYDYDKSVYTVTVTVTDNSVGTLSAEVGLAKNHMPSSEIVFVNGFAPTPLTYDIHADFGGEKVLDGRPLAENEFEFVLINAINGVQIGDAVKNDANGEFRFPSLTLPQAGIYHYKIVETTGTEKGVSYDNASYHIRVEVEQDTNGVLSIVSKELHKGTVTKQEIAGVLTEVTSYEDITASGKIVFNNTYRADPVYVTLEATKILLGRDLKDGEFKFDLYKTNDTFAIDGLTPTQDNVVLTLNDNGTGNIAFMPEEFDTEGTYHYVIVEDEVDANGVTADDTAYKVEIVVTDNHKGNLEATLKIDGNTVNGALADTVTFENVYKAAATEIVIRGQKTLEGRDLEAEEFSFELYDSNNDKIETVKNAANGIFAFTPITIDEAGEYVYTVREVKGSADNVTYDETVYTVKAVVTDNLDGTFQVEYTYLKGTDTATGVTFLNLYTAPTPDVELPQTGDHNHHWIWFALAFVSGAFALSNVFLAKKKEDNAEN